MRGIRTELARVGIRGRLADRIEAELADHLACDPDADLGDPRELAERFAAELRVPRTRRAAHLGFGGLALVAALLGVGLGSTPRAGGTAGLVVSLAGLAIVLGAQVAFVGGVLALWGAHVRTAAAVVQRRLALALVGGVLVLAGAAVDAVALGSWRALAVLAAAPLLAAAALEARTAAGLTPERAAVARGLTPREQLAVGVLVVAFVTVGSAFAERSWGEGVTRGAVEAAAFAAGLALLGRFAGIRTRSA